MFCRRIFGPACCVYLISITAFSDIGAYCLGKAIKGPKLCPKISPNKTWAGFFGGVFLANFACYCLNNFFLRESLGEEFLCTIVGNFIIVQVMILASVAGDLLESFFKRRIGVKDMGTLFPGHGGMLDRLDSLIVASIVLVVISFWFECIY
jgi:phosphatidate cytidylyltransferase